ncbi:MAG: hypothetical protein IE926_06350 [Micrococcales bacterium]|nr:hypothetical protein [Micrococcales bacterium]
MTTVHASEQVGPGSEDDPTLAADLAELRLALVAHPFPTRQDDLIAACLVLGVPARVCCRLSRLERTQELASLDEVCAAVAAAGPPRTR